MNKKMFIKLPNIVRNSENDGLEITADEIALAILLLSNKTGERSLTTLGLIEYEFGLTNTTIRTFSNIITQVHDKGLVKIKNIDDIRKSFTKNTPIEVMENINEKSYMMLSLSLVDKIMRDTTIRFNRQRNVLYTLVILQSRGGHRRKLGDKGSKGFSFPSQKSLAEDIGATRQTVNACIDDLVRLDIINIVKYGNYTSTNKKGQTQVKEYNNNYIIIQPYMTKALLRQIIKDSETAMREQQDKALEDKMFSQLITHKTGDDYNENRELSREDELKLADYEKKHYEKIEKQRVEREIEEQQEALENWKKDIENGQKPY